jgi:hypothetical protein
MVNKLSKEKIMIKLVLVVIGILLILAAGPLLIIWSMNTLFPVLSIPYTWETWAAAVLLGGVFSTKITK